MQRSGDVKEGQCNRPVTVKPSRWVKTISRLLAELEASGRTYGTMQIHFAGTIRRVTLPGDASRPEDLVRMFPSLGDDFEDSV